MDKAKVEVVRIQPVDTWVNWIFYQTKLLLNTQNGREQERYKLILTNEEPRFITQFNIKDDDEIILVPPETEPKRTHSFHIVDEQIVETYLSTLSDIGDKYKDFVVNSRSLNPFASCLQLVRELQTHLLVVSDFCSQRNLWSTVDKGHSHIIPVSYKEAQSFFPIDYASWEEKYANWLGQRGEKQFYIYCKSDCETLGDALSVIFPEEYPDTEDVSKRVETIFRYFPTAPKEVLTKDTKIVAFLEGKDVKESSRSLNKYLSGQSLFSILRAIIREAR